MGSVPCDFVGSLQMGVGGLRSDHLCMKDAQGFETNEKSYIRFYRFLVIDLKDVNIRLKKIVQKRPNLQGICGLI